MDYTSLIKEVNIPELIKVLRNYSEVAITAAVGKLVCDAANAVEALSNENAILHQQFKDLNEAFRIESKARQKAEAEVKQAAKRNAELHAELEKWVSAAEKSAQPHWVSVKDEKPKDKQECFVAFKGPLGFIYDHGRFYDELNSGLDEDTFEDGTSGFVLDGDVGYALESIDYWMSIKPQEVQDADK